MRYYFHELMQNVLLWLLIAGWFYQRARCSSRLECSFSRIGVGSWLVRSARSEGASGLAFYFRFILSEFTMEVISERTEVSSVLPFKGKLSTFFERYAIVTTSARFCPGT